jgi:hypothetical protein
VSDELPPDPFDSPKGPVWSNFIEAALLWEALREMSLDEQIAAVDALSEDDVRVMVLERLVFERLKFTLNSDGSVEREEFGAGG